MRKTQVAVLLDQHEFVRARDEAKDLHQHNPDDATVHGYLARAYIGLGNYQDAEASAQWMLNLQPFNVPGLLIAAQLREHYGDPEGALEALNRAYAETPPGETAELASIANQIASIDIDMGKADSANQMLQRAEELFPGYPETLKNRARAGVAHSAAKTAADPVPLKEFPWRPNRPFLYTGCTHTGAGRAACSPRYRYGAHDSNHAEPGATQP